MKLILFDIDGTLLDTGGTGLKCINKIFYEIFQIKDALGSVSCAGKTDPMIFREILELNGISVNGDNIDKSLSAYLTCLKTEIKSSNKRLKPGIIEILKSVSKVHRVGLLTGNLRDGAMVKLDSFGITDYFEEGAYGSDNEDRTKLLPVALERFNKKHGTRFLFRDCIIIGDTPRDVSCAKPHGAKVIAVATGPYSFEDLSKTEADVVFHDLGNTSRVMEVIASM